MARCDNTEKPLLHMGLLYSSFFEELRTTLYPDTHSDKELKALGFTVKTDRKQAAHE